MSSQAYSTSPASSAPHGGDMDPNAIRLRQARAQQSTMSSTNTANNPAMAAAGKPPHGGDMDPHDVRLRLARLQQTSSSSTPTLGTPEPSNTLSQPNGFQTPQTGPQSAQYGSSSRLVNTPSSPPSGYGMYQNAQSPQSTYSAQYFPSQYPHQPSDSGHPQHIPQSPYPGLANQGNINYPMPTMPAQNSPGSPYAPTPKYGPSQPSPVNNGNMNDSAAKEARSLYQGPAERGYFNARHPRTEWRAKWPNAYQVAGIALPIGNHHHRDMMQRGKDFPADEYYLSPFDGHLAKLFVQSTQAIYNANPNSTWRRTFIRNQSPWILRVANWVFHTLPTGDSEAKGEDIAMAGFKWIPACAAILVLMIYPVRASGQVRNEGKYDMFPYQFWGYPYQARNPQEDKIEMSNHSNGLFTPSTALQSQTIKSSKRALNPISERPVEPQYLCFLKKTQGMEIRTVSEWKSETGNEATYILVSYTSEQFRTEEEQLFLHEVGEHAARAAGVQAYWVGCSCLGRTKQEQEDNVWRISDVVRGARRLIIAVSSANHADDADVDKMVLLRQWGTRVWTLPEILLIPSNSDIHIYARNENMNTPMTINKRNFAILWKDAPISRELIDHYEGNLILSSLELVTIALQCLHNRQKGFYLPGDMAYALMGLLRRRPTIVKTDSAFQAFARLSLANDNDLLLERLICLLPKTPSQPWYEMEDQWGVSLWDVNPTTQICGIADKDTVIIDGAYAAAIRWKAFAPVASLTREAWRRAIFRYGFRSASYLFFLGIILVSAGVSQKASASDEGISSSAGGSYIALGAIFLVISLPLILLAPYIIRLLYTGKLWATQAWFFGFEGYMDIASLERHIFGANMGHLKWSTNGSPLSVHSPNNHGECIGHDPTSIPSTAQKVENAINARMGEQRIFTLVDTNTLTVTLFEAVRPPIAVVLCGAEGGMQRALLCSYEWSTQTLYRESVMRMETVILEKMQRVGRLRLGLNRGGDGA